MAGIAERSALSLCNEPNHVSIPARAARRANASVITALLTLQNAISNKREIVSASLFFKTSFQLI
jgi:hypothetical protein